LLNIDEKIFPEIKMVKNALHLYEKWNTQCVEYFKSVKNQLKLAYSNLKEKFSKYNSMDKFQGQSQSEKLSSIYHNCIYSHVKKLL